MWAATDDSCCAALPVELDFVVCCLATNEQILMGIFQVLIF